MRDSGTTKSNTVSVSVHPMLALIAFVTMAQCLAGQNQGFVQSGAGARSRDVQSKLRDTINILDFGAKCDGATDDTTAIQNALNSLPQHGKNPEDGFVLRHGTILVPDSGPMHVFAS